MECQNFVKMLLQFSIARQSKTQRLLISFHNWKRKAANPHIQEAGTSKCFGIFTYKMSNMKLFIDGNDLTVVAQQHIPMWM